MINRYWKWTAWMAIVMFTIGIGYGVGYGTGFGKGVAWAVSIGLNFAEVDIDEEMLLNGIFQYKNNIQGCFENKIEGVIIT